MRQTPTGPGFRRLPRGPPVAVPATNASGLAPLFSRPPSLTTSGHPSHHVRPHPTRTDVEPQEATSSRQVTAWVLPRAVVPDETSRTMSHVEGSACLRADQISHRPANTRPPAFGLLPFRFTFPRSWLAASQPNRLQPSRYSSPKPSKYSVVIMGARSQPPTGPRGPTEDRPGVLTVIKTSIHPFLELHPAHPIIDSAVIRMQDRSHHLIISFTAIEGPSDGSGGRSTMHGLPDGEFALSSWEGIRDGQNAHCQSAKFSAFEWGPWLRSGRRLSMPDPSPIPRRIDLRVPAVSPISSPKLLRDGNARNSYSCWRGITMSITLFHHFHLRLPRVHQQRQQRAAHIPLTNLLPVFPL